MTMDLKEKIEDFYNVKITDFGYLHFNGKTIPKMIKSKNNVLYLRFNVSVKDETEAEKLAAAGKIVKTTTTELYDLFAEDVKKVEEEKMEKDLENIKIISAGMTEDFGTVYSLSCRVPSQVWQKIKHFFFYAKKGDEMGMDADDYTLGWITLHPGNVENLLNIKPENRLSYRNDAAQKRADEKIAKREEAINEAKDLGEKYNILADWSWDDYRFDAKKTVEETKYWIVKEYHRQSEIGKGDWQIVGYTLNQKDNSLGIIAYSEYAGDALAQVIEDPSGAVKAMCENEMVNEND